MSNELKRFRAELLCNTPVSREAFRLASLELRKTISNWDSLSDSARRKACIALLWNTEDIFLKRAKFNLENRQ